MKTQGIGIVAWAMSLLGPVVGEELDLGVGAIQLPSRYQIHVQGDVDGIRKGSIADGSLMITFEIGGQEEDPAQSDSSIIWIRKQEVGDRTFDISLLEDANDQRFARVTVNSILSEKFSKSYPAIFRVAVNDETLSGLLIADIVATAMSYQPYQKPVEPLDWDAIRNKPAGVTVLNMVPVDLRIAPEEKKKGWLRVPMKFREVQTRIFEATGTTNGVSDFEVTNCGYLFVACNYDYQGNKSGDWEEGSWSKVKFQQEGWRLLTKEELEGILVSVENRTQAIFIKQVKKGDRGRLRCNKYEPPYFILQNNLPTPLSPEELEKVAKIEAKSRDLFPVMSPILDVDPLDRSPKTLKIPTGFTIKRHDGKVSVVTIPENFTEIEVTVGKNMLVGSHYQVTAKRGAKLVGGMSGMPMPDDSHWLTIEQTETPAVVSIRVYWFETDIPPQHFWSPSSSPNFKTLWDRTFAIEID